MDEPTEQNDCLRVEWMPIETAPKKGSILIFSPRHGIAHVRWCSFGGRMIEPGKWEGGWDAEFNNSDGWDDANFDDATHWRPLPPPPEPPKDAATPESVKAIWQTVDSFAGAASRDALARVTESKTL